MHLPSTHIECLVILWHRLVMSIKLALLHLYLNSTLGHVHVLGGGGGGGEIKNDEQMSNTTNRKAFMAHFSTNQRKMMWVCRILKTLHILYSYSLQHLQCMCTSRGLWGHDVHVHTNDQSYGNYAHIEDQSFGTWCTYSGPILHVYVATYLCACEGSMTRMKNHSYGKLRLYREELL